MSTRLNGAAEPAAAARKKKRNGANREKAIDRGIRAVAQLERKAYKQRSRADRIATAITRLAGTGGAIFVHAIWFSVWLLFNDYAPRIGYTAFDPYPFNLLTTIVSLEAIFLTLFVLISQNRMSKEADRRAELDLQVNVLAEREATMTLRILHEISTHLGLKGSASHDLAELIKETRLEDLSRKLERELPEDK